MKKLLLLAVLVFGAIGLNACLVAPVIPPVGLAYSNLQAPLDIDYHASPVVGKHGTSESMAILGLVALGDASAATAAQNGGIKTIDHADYEYFNVLGVYQRYRTVVYGD